MDWFRWHHGTVSDPKWRVVAADAGAKVRDVLAVFAAMLENASQADTRGVLSGWNDRVVGAALDMTGDEVRAIREAMQGLVLDGDRLTGWERRQPKREDGASERAKAWRERSRTQPNAQERPDTDTEKKYPVADATDAAPASDLPTDRELVWGDGLTWLARETDRTPKAMRPLVGRWCATYGEAAVLQVMTEVRAQSPPPVEPVAWIEGALKARRTGHGRIGQHGRGDKRSLGGAFMDAVAELEAADGRPARAELRG